MFDVLLCIKHLIGPGCMLGTCPRCRDAPPSQSWASVSSRSTPPRGVVSAGSAATRWPDWSALSGLW